MTDNDNNHDFTEQDCAEVERAFRTATPAATNLHFGQIQKTIAEDSPANIAVVTPPPESIPYLTIASSWACGAAIGAALVFFLLQSSDSTPSPTDDGVAIQVKAEPTNSESIVEEQASEPASQTTYVQAAPSLESLLQGDLRVGSHLVSHSPVATDNQPKDSQTTAPNSQPRETEQDWSNGSPRRGQLRRELLHDLLL